MSPKMSNFKEFSLRISLNLSPKHEQLKNDPGESELTAQSSQSI